MHKMVFYRKIINNIEKPLNFIDKILIKLELDVWKYRHGACNFNVFVLNALIYMYTKCKIVHKPQEVLDNDHMI